MRMISCEIGPLVRIASILLLLALLVSGCTITTSCTLFNNTSYEVVVEIESLGGETRSLSLAPLSSAEIDNWPASVLQISTPNKTWSYSSEDPNEKFIRFSGFGPWTKRRFKAQLQEDGRIFVIDPKAPFPQIEFPIQPHGYPLEPR